jgi:hypothetical protein
MVAINGFNNEPVFFMPALALPWHYLGTTGSSNQKCLLLTITTLWNHWNHLLYKKENISNREEG